MFQNAFAVVLQLCLATLAFAAPIVDETVSAKTAGNTWQYGTGGGIIGFIILILDIMVWIEVLKSNRAPSSKILWCLVVFLFPVIGLIAYYLLADRASHTGSGSYEPLPQ
ncbi:hypothetical protein DL546_001051 [Coniochaeta pulveracea]|uniref:Cardiolipin synthase N-terminal domain-containing protein n=1 Tax=Coniochaeta pulveracea TaxID=177199 RepID=A0A420XVV5_9PEZI|nr:hypothetical protein DL546_001051 [Coniochaeta pulveracea]